MYRSITFGIGIDKCVLFYYKQKLVIENLRQRGKKGDQGIRVGYMWNRDGKVWRRRGVGEKEKQITWADMKGRRKEWVRGEETSWFRKDTDVRWVCCF